MCGDISNIDQAWIESLMKEPIIKAGQIGEPQRHIEIEPLEEPATEPIHEPAAPERQPETVPAAPEPKREEVPA